MSIFYCSYYYLLLLLAESQVPNLCFFFLKTGLILINCAFLHTYIHTYIHNWPLQPFSMDYGLASHTTHVVCFNFIRQWHDLQFKIDSERQISEKLFHGRFIYSQSFCQKSSERKWPKEIFFSYFMLMPDMRCEPWFYA